MVYLHTEDLDFNLDDLPVLPPAEQVLMTTPDFFDVGYVINPHMEGNIGRIDRPRALLQWDAVREVYARLGFPVHTVEGTEGLLDMVFCANQTLPYFSPYDHACGVIMSRMHAEQRRGEVPHYADFFRQQGYTVHDLPEEKPGDFEGMGDAIWHPGRYLLWGGYGFRTSLNSYEHLSQLLNVHVLAVLLEDPDFYHLDTCFSVLNERTALIFPGAFQPDGLRLIHHFFPDVIEAPEVEARRLFACNAHAPDGKHVILQQGAIETCRKLRDAGFEPIEVDTGEFLKAGGSVFCMKQMFW